MRKLTLLLIAVTFISGCAMKPFRYKAMDGVRDDNFPKVYAECREKAVVWDQVQPCLYNKGWVWTDRE